MGSEILPCRHKFLLLSASFLFWAAAITLGGWLLTVGYERLSSYGANLGGR